MLDWVIDYDICSLAFFVVFMCYYFMKKRFLSITNQIFTHLWILVLVSIIIELISIYTLSNRYDIPLWINYLVNCGYLFTINLVCFIFSIYIVLNIRQGRFTKGRWYWYLAYTPAFIDLVLIITTPVTKWVIYFDENKDYHYGIGLYILYAIAVLYLITSLIISIINYRKFNYEKRLAIYLFICITIFAVCFQALNPRYLVTGIASTIGVLAVYLSQQNPQDTTEQISNLFNRSAMIMRINEYINKKKNFTAIILLPDEVDDFYRLHGFLCGDYMQRQVADYLVGLTSSEEAFAIGSSRFVLLLEGNSDHIKIINKIKTRFNDSWKYKDMSFTLSVSMSCLMYPEDAKSTEELVDMLEAAIIYATKEGKGTVLLSEDYIYSRERMINRLEQNQKMLENKTREAEEAKAAAERADRSKSSFLAHMSHEIRTPMTTILGLTEILLRENVEHEVRQNLLSIQNAGRSLITIINDILDFSKIEAGKMEIVDEPYHIASTLDNAFNTVIIKLRNRDIEFITDIDPNIPSVLIGDETRVRQIMINFLSNAVKYTNTGTITLDVKWNNSEHMLEVSVTDTGRGISEQNMSRLFDSFERFDTKRNKAVEGTGLGLSICKKILDQMNGNMKVESKYGKGSKFSFRVHQGVKNSSPLAVVSDKDKIKVMIYVTDEEKNIRIKKIFESLHIMADIGKDMSIRDRINEDYTHVVLDKDTYEYYNRDANSSIVVFMLNGSNELMKHSNEFIYIMHPLNCISIAAAFLNNALDMEAEQNEVQDFIAPKSRMLVIDDNYVNLQIVKELLAPHQMKVDVAESGKEGIHLTELYKYDIIFLDHMMPIMDGIDTLREIKNDEENKNLSTPVIAFTANAVSGMKDAFKKEGFVDYLSKPINITKMENIIRHYLPEEKIINIKHDINEDSDMIDREIVERQYPDQITGIDIKTGVSNMGGDIDKLMRLLRIVHLEGIKKVDLIDKFYEDKDLKHYTIEVHALKSTMASVGAIGLSEIAKIIEKAGKNEDYDTCERYHDRMMKMYREILSKIEEKVVKNTMFDSADDNRKVETDKETLNVNERLLCILALLHDFEYDLAEKQFKRLKVVNTDEDLKPVINDINEKFELFAYDEIEEIIQKMLKE